MNDEAAKENSGFEKRIEEKWKSLGNPKTRAKANQEINRHAAHPGLVEIPAEIAQQFQERIQFMRKHPFPPDTPQEYVDSFLPLVEHYFSIPPIEDQHVISFDLWTQHLVLFTFAYGEECINSFLWKQVFTLLSLPPDFFLECVNGDLPDGTDKAEAIRAIVKIIDKDVLICYERALEMFVEVLRSRLGTIVVDTYQECAIRAINELRAELTFGDSLNLPKLRQTLLKGWTGIQKVRLETPPPGAPTFKTAQEFEILLDEAQEKLATLGLEYSKTAVVEYINRHHPNVRCSGTRHFNRLIDKFGMAHKFPPDRGETRHKRRRRK